MKFPSKTKKKKTKTKTKTKKIATSKQKVSRIAPFIP